MPGYRILVVDAFTRTPYAGNPAAVVLDATGICDARVPAVACPEEVRIAGTAVTILRGTISV